MLDFRNDRADAKSESAIGSRPYFVDMADKSLLSDTRKSNKAKTSDDGVLEFDNVFASTIEPQIAGKDADDAFSFKSLDQNKNGRVSQYEAVEAFRKYDKNEDGALSKSEIPASDIMDGMDRNKDGNVTLQESLCKFNSLDSNKDGSIDKKEFDASADAKPPQDHGGDQVDPPRDGGGDHSDPPHDTGDKPTLPPDMMMLTLEQLEQLVQEFLALIEKELEWLRTHGGEPPATSPPPGSSEPPPGSSSPPGNSTPPPSTPEPPPTSTPPTPPPTSPPPPDGSEPPPSDTPKPPDHHEKRNFSVKDGDIIGPDGKKFVARGINVDGRDANFLSDEMLENFPGLNFVRLATSPSGKPFDKQIGKADPEAMEGIQQFIDKMTARGIVVEVENHAGGTPTGQALQDELDFYSQLAEHNKNNPYVWFGSNNEPGAKTEDVSAIVNEQQQVYNTIRGAGNNNMIMFETAYGGVAKSEDPIRQNEDFDTYKNVAIDAHWYGSRFGENVGNKLSDRLDKFDEFRSADGELPVIIGEYGPGIGRDHANDVPLQYRHLSVDAVQEAVDKGEADGAAAWLFGHVTRDTYDPTGENGWTTNNTLAILSEDRSKFLGLSTWGKDVADWIEHSPETDNPHPNPDPPAKGELADLLAQNDFDRRGLVVADAPFRGPHGWAFGKFKGMHDIATEEPFKTAPWGVIYPKDGMKVDPDADVQVKDTTVYYHLKTGGWVEAMNPSTNHWWEGNYPADFHDHVHQHGDGKRLPDGTFEFSSPPLGMNDHFGPGRPALLYDPKLYDGVMTTMSARADRENSGMVMQVGTDHCDRKYGTTTPGFGGNNWTELTTQWQQLYYTSLDPEIIKNDPPPGLD